MCDLCNDPNLTPDAYVQQLRERLRDRRFLVQSVGGSRDSAEFSYTIGLTAHGLPELIVIGRRHDEATTLLKVWGDYVMPLTEVPQGCLSNVPTLGEPEVSPLGAISVCAGACR